MNIDEIVTAWARCKRRFARRRLAAPCSVEHEYQGRPWGHPSTYAYVRFDCAPAEGLSLEFTATWPADLTPDYRQLVHDAMTAAVADVLVAADDPHLGCSLTCVEVKWDDVASSEMSFYRATKAAITLLMERERWGP